MATNFTAMKQLTVTKTALKNPRFWVDKNTPEYSTKTTIYNISDCGVYIDRQRISFYGHIDTLADFLHELNVLSVSQGYTYTLNFNY